MNNAIFNSLESNVRSYCRTFPRVFDRALGAMIWDEDGNEFIDFFAGAGTMNYGHNNPYIKGRVLEFLVEDRILHALDMHTVAKRNFLETFERRVLQPKGMVYKVQFTGPTGTNAVEAALKIARRVKGRTNIFAFTGGFHGMSLGALSVTANTESRAAAGVPLGHGAFLPYPSNIGGVEGSLIALERILTDTHSGVDKPAAVILETVQAEGGVNPAPVEWLRGVEAICRTHDLCLIVDDIQVGCFRTKEFFSFESAGISPDLVILSKSIGGIGFPMSLVLIKPELDIWGPGEHTGTFRGNQIAFVAAAAALDFAAETDLPSQVRRHEEMVMNFLETRIAPLHEAIKVRGRGLIWGVDMTGVGGGAIAKRIGIRCFANGLVIERAGRDDAVLKLLPPLTIADDILQRGLDILHQAIADELGAT
ncbi:diaminobutyrate--2-oxoglutarate transaminase [Methyloglobulus sp.]|uniref:diaminobutyrate--2-oxoglutarate transaminase n=1 Tax=Methyloglobulus sp. TaxID=2518622 RepID=UPI003988AB4D